MITNASAAVAAIEARLDAVRQMSATGLSAGQIASALGIAPSAMAVATQVPALRDAIEQGRAEGVAAIAARLYAAALAGDSAACRFFLERIGGWAPPRITVRAEVAESATRGSDLAPITLEHVDALQANQRALMARLALEGTGGS